MISWFLFHLLLKLFQGYAFIHPLADGHTICAVFRIAKIILLLFRIVFEKIYSITRGQAAKRTKCDTHSSVLQRRNYATAFKNN